MSDAREYEKTELAAPTFWFNFTPDIPDGVIINTMADVRILKTDGTAPDVTEDKDIKMVPTTKLIDPGSQKIVSARIQGGANQSRYLVYWKVTLSDGQELEEFRILFVNDGFEVAAA